MPRKPRIKDITGQRFGRLTAIRHVGSVRHSATWLCQCQCGNSIIVPNNSLQTGNTKSCGCIRGEIKAVYNTPEYSSWKSMLWRCYDPRCNGYERYGGRGVTVCDRWMSFDAFLADMGKKPSRKYTIDRIDGTGNYEPGNCRWATNVEQSNNRRSNRHVTYQGETLTTTEWARKLGMKDITFRSRLKYGWSMDRIVSTPVNHYYRADAK